MIDLIVLGHIPGTPIDLQFDSVLILGALYLSGLFAYKVFVKEYNAKAKIKQILEISL